jgi:hypothetical protein
MTPSEGNRPPFGVLDRKERTTAVRLTKLSKVLQLKRPGLIPLYDDNVWRAYSKRGNVRVAPVRGRSWKDFSSLAPRDQEGPPGRAAALDGHCRPRSGRRPGRDPAAGPGHGALAEG